MKVSGETFEPIEVDTVAEAVIEQIERLLVDGVLRSGQRLPPERELAERLGVSRLKLRDALAALEARGLVVARQGDGTYVAALIGTALSPAMLELFARHPAAFLGYLEFRQETEGFATFLAAQRATETDRTIIRRIIEAMREAHTDFDPAREADLDVKFHAAIVDAAHNAMLSQVMASIYELIARGVFYNRNFLYGRADARDREGEDRREDDQRQDRGFGGGGDRVGGDQAEDEVGEGRRCGGFGVAAESVAQPLGGGGRHRKGAEQERQQEQGHQPRDQVAGNEDRDRAARELARARRIAGRGNAGDEESDDQRDDRHLQRVEPEQPGGLDIGEAGGSGGGRQAFDRDPQQHADDERRKDDPCRFQVRFSRSRFRPLAKPKWVT